MGLSYNARSLNLLIFLILLLEQKMFIFDPMVDTCELFDGLFLSWFRKYELEISTQKGYLFEIVVENMKKKIVSF